MSIEQRQFSPAVPGEIIPGLIFVIGAQRSGTTVFRKLLERHGALDAGEIFLMDVRGEYNFYRYLRNALPDAPELIHPLRHARAFPDFVAHVQNKAKGRQVVMDVKYNALGLVPSAGGVPFLPDFARASGCAVVQIVRRNKLRAAVSLRLAQKTNRWAIRAEDAAKPQEPTPKIWMKPAALLADIERREAEDATVRAQLTGVQFLEEVSYESMFDETGGFSSPVVEIASHWLGKDQIDRTPAHAKGTTRPLWEIIENYAAVEDALRQSRFSWMLDAE